jgi:hypothetical protein
MTAMSRDREASIPTPSGMRGFHAAKRKIHNTMRKMEQEARRSMGDWSP